MWQCANIYCSDEHTLVRRHTSSRQTLIHNIGSLFSMAPAQDQIRNASDLEHPICSDGLGLWSSNTNTPLATQPPWPRPRVQRGLLSITGLQPIIQLPACSSLHGATRNAVWGSTSKADRGGAAYSSVSQPHSHTPGGIGHPPNKSHPAMAGVAGERTQQVGCLVTLQSIPGPRGLIIWALAFHMSCITLFTAFSHCLFMLIPPFAVAHRGSPASICRMEFVFSYRSTDRLLGYWGQHGITAHFHRTLHPHHRGLEHRNNVLPTRGFALVS